MKNKRIMNAYDSINPSPADKQRMLDAILADAGLEDAPQKTREKVVYTKKQSTKTSRSNIVGTLAAAAALFVVAGFGLAFLLNREPADPAYVEPTSVSMDPAPEMNAAYHYAPVLEKYRRAIAEAWTKQQCEIEGISLRMQAGGDFSRAGYALADLDGDGREELIIAEESVPHIDNIWDLYTTLEDGTPIQLWVDECEGGQCRLYEGNVISISDSYKDELDVTFYCLEAGKLVARESLQWEDEDTVYHTDGDGNTRQVTSKEGQSISNAYDIQKLDLTWFADVPVKMQSVTGYEGYDSIINKYVTALTENWTAEQCHQNDISPDIFSGTTIRNHLGWRLYDVDNNGVEELIITDGIHVFDLYVMQPHNGGPGHILCANGGESWQLCENGVIQMRGNYSGTTAWRYYTLSDIDLVQRDMVFYVGEENQYYYGADDDHLELVSKETVGVLLSRDRSMELSLTPFLEPEPIATDVSDQYQPLLELYRKAIWENWNPGQCVENGISLMIGYYREIYASLGYCQKDLNGDGIEELIITDGNNIYDLYTLISDETEGPLRLVDAMERLQYFLNTDGYIYAMGSSSAVVNNHALYTLGQRELVFQKGYMMDANENMEKPWFYYDGVNRGDPCPAEEAVAAMDAIDVVEIPFIPFE